MDNKQYKHPEANDVKRLATGAAKWAIALMVIKQLVTIATTMVVSRHVSPEDTGLVGMVSVLIAFIVLLDTGLTWATVQPKDLDKEQVDGMYWLGWIIGTILFLLCAAAGPMLAWFYGQDELILICIVMGIGPFMNSLTTQPAALLKRQLRQKTTNGIDAAAIVASSIIAVSMALGHMGYWTIVAQLVSLHISRFLLLSVFSGYRPSTPRLTQGSLKVFKIGGTLAINNYVTFFQLYLSSILIGRIFGSEALGYYIKANALKGLPTMYATMIVTDVMVASLSALQSDPPRMKAAYIKALRLTAFIGCPAAAMLFPLAPDLVHVLYGTQWGISADLLRQLSISAVILPITTTTIWLFLASGKAQEQLKMNLILTTAVLLTYSIAINWIQTIEHLVALEVILFTLPIPIANLYFSHKAADLETLKSIKSIAPIIATSLIAAASAEILSQSLQEHQIHWTTLATLKACTGIGLYAILSLIFIRPHPFHGMRR